MYLFKEEDKTSFIAAFGESAVLVFSEHTKKISLVKILLISGIVTFIGVSFGLSDLELYMKFH